MRKTLQELKEAATGNPNSAITDNNSFKHVQEITYRSLHPSLIISDLTQGSAGAETQDEGKKYTLHRSPVQAG